VSASSSDSAGPTRRSPSTASRICASISRSRRCKPRRIRSTATSRVSAPDSSRRAERDECRTFLETVARNLARLDVDGIEREKSILRIEASRKGKGIVDALLFDRFGAQSYGLGWFPEYGLWTLDGRAVRDWAANGFTKGNAAGWMVGPKPLAVTLGLADGRRLPAPPSEARAIDLPSVVRRPGRFVGAGGVVGRSTAALMAGAVLGRRLRRLLRFEMGAAYEVAASYVPLDATTAHLAVWSDVAEAKAADVVRTFLATVADAELANVDEDLEAERAAALASFEGSEVDVGIADGMAFDELLGSETATREALRAEYRGMSAVDVRRVAAAVRATAIHEVPAGVDAPVAGLHAPSRWSSWSVEGDIYQPAAGIDGTPERFVVGERGLTVWVGDHPLSVEWSRVVAMPCWSDGGRRLIAADGTAIIIAPSRVRNGRELVDRLDACVPPARRVHVGKRLAPPVRPPVRHDPRARRRWARQRSFNAVLGVVLLILLLPLLGPAHLPVATAVGIALAEIAVIGGAIAAVALVRRAETAVGGSTDGIELYDYAEGHRQQLQPEAPAIAPYVRGGTLLAFLVLHDLTNAWFATESGAAVDRLRRREITGPELYREWDGILASDMLSPAGNEFLFDFLAVRSKKGSRYRRTQAATSFGPNALPVTWESYDRIAPALDRELAQWRRWRLAHRFARMVRLPPVF
jgi:hypothetical protein